MKQRTAYLIAKMKKVVQKDHYAIMSQQPAISRLCLIRELKVASRYFLIGSQKIKTAAIHEYKSLNFFTPFLRTYQQRVSIQSKARSLSIGYHSEMASYSLQVELQIRRGLQSLEKQRDLRQKIKQIGIRMDMSNAEEELIKRNPLFRSS
ncbi:UNKNOWN [Stylonychia lemnae]|uniref:Uncharacterized protein n=1 Tax=Stylonychia lemnae TaxID=5949 RepID=A0A078AS28_STYLE|nr:UNKNOWN [Stylonychia lemnae]|eukprot:CDW84974.1 UNKNOWN [Stylonychia lemnae]